MRESVCPIWSPGFLYNNAVAGIGFDRSDLALVEFSLLSWSITFCSTEVQDGANHDNSVRQWK